MILRNLLAIFILIACFGCSPYYRDYATVNTTEVSRVILTYSTKLKYEKHLQLENSKIYFDRYINRIRLDYSAMDNMAVCEARELLVDVVGEFLDRINQNAIIYPYLWQTPFDASNLEVYIYFESFYNKYIDPQLIGLITLKGGIATYYTSDALTCEDGCWHQRSEYYCQSKNFVTFSRQGEALFEPRIEKEPFADFEELYR